MTFAMTVAVSCRIPKQLEFTSPTEHAVWLLDGGREKDETSLWCGVTFECTIPGGQTASTTAVGYCWSMGQCCQVSGLHLCMKNSSMFLDFIPKTGQTSDGSQHVIKETAINTRPLLAVQILVGLLPFPPPTALSTTSVPSFIQDLNSSQK